jgi:hypothetical protein
MPDRCTYQTPLALVVLLLTFGGVAGAQTADGQAIDTPRCSAGVHPVEATGMVFLPEDQIFCPLLADPKEARSFLSFLRGTFPSLDDPSGKGTSIASAGLGDSFGLLRWGGPGAGEGVQLDVVGSIFAQFDIGSSSNDLINADYIIGLPLTLRVRGFSVRTRLYHQSSHLGDEFLLRDEGTVRENLSFESVEVLVSQEAGPIRAYLGGERVFRREPAMLPDSLFHAGIELRSSHRRPFQLVGGVDVKTVELEDWSPALSARIGVEVGRPSPADHPGRRITLVVEYYDGPSPYGQFFQDDISYVGAGIHFGL